MARLDKFRFVIYLSYGDEEVEKANYGKEERKGGGEEEEEGVKK